MRTKMYGKKTTEDFFYPKWELSGFFVAWENNWHFAMLLLISLQNVTTQIWLVPLIGWKILPTWYNQSEAQPRSGSDKASIWNFCIRSSGIILWGNQWCWCKCQLSCQARFSGNSNSWWKSLSNHQRDDDYWHFGELPLFSSHELYENEKCSS